MFERVLVPLDGSPLSEAALPIAKKLLEGGAREATLFAVGHAPKATRLRRRSLRRPLPLSAASLGMGQVGSTMVIPPDEPAYVETMDQAVDRLEHELLEYLAGVGHDLLETGAEVHVAVHFGEPAREIVDYAKEGGFDLIVMATHGRSGVRETLQGSVTAEVLRSGVAPVLAVRPERKKGRS